MEKKQKVMADVDPSMEESVEEEALEVVVEGSWGPGQGYSWSERTMEKTGCGMSPLFTFSVSLRGMSEK